ISSGGVILTGQGSSSITYRANCSGTVNLAVTVTTACSSSDSKSILSVSPTATLSVVGPSTILQGGSAQLQVALTGTGPWSVTWSDNPSQPQTISTSPA